MSRRFLSLAASAFYRIGYKLHHKIFLRPQPQLHTPVVIVGSYLVGGAGKTPFTLWLAEQFLEQNKKIAVLCHCAAWDEFILLQQELQDFPNATIIATKNRYATAKKIQNKFDIILCDDGFEDSRFTGATRYCLDWEEPPTSWTKLWPAGMFRSLKQDHDENDVIHLRCCSDIQFSIDSITNYKQGSSITATIICGIGNPERFSEDIRTFGKVSGTNIHIEKILARPDHDKHFPQIIEAELALGKDIIISQKDACRLPQTLLAQPKLHIAIQRTNVSECAQRMIKARLRGHDD